MYHFTIKIPARMVENFEEQAHLEQRVFEVFTQITPEQVRAKIRDEGYEEGYKIGVQHGREDGYNEAKVFTVVAQPTDPLRGKKRGTRGKRSTR